MSIQKIEADLRAFTDSFVNLVRAARLGDETSISKKSKVHYISQAAPVPIPGFHLSQGLYNMPHVVQAPGELVEVLAEKMLLAAQDLFQTTAELKRRAFLASAGKQLAKAERVQTLVNLQARVAGLEAEIAEAEEVCISMALRQAWCRKCSTGSVGVQVAAARLVTHPSCPPHV